MLDWPKGVTCVTAEEKKKCINDYKDNTQDLVKPTYLTGKKRQQKISVPI